MKTIYLDSTFMCHAANDGTMRAVETDAFDGKCGFFIEGFRFVPAGESWTRADGSVFAGEMLAPAEDYAALAKAQQQYERDEQAHLAELGALIEEIYNEDVDMIDGM